MEIPDVGKSDLLIIPCRFFPVFSMAPLAVHKYNKKQGKRVRILLAGSHLQIVTALNN